MTDDLVRMLRQPNGILDWQLRQVCADHIEKLEAALREIVNKREQFVFITDEEIDQARRALERKP